MLRAYVPAVATYTGDDMSLDRMWPLLKSVGNPQDSLSAIHIAGTSGKTSTSYYITHCLAAAGKKIGLTVSPHVDSITERVQINGKPLEEKLFCRYLTEFMHMSAKADVQPSYFELLTAFELWVFVQESVDYAVIETGMGGLWDASNVVTASSKVCVITDIGLDHTHILGDTIDQIAKQKAGIIHADNAVFMNKQSDNVTGIVQKRIDSVEAQQIRFASDADVAGELPGFQQRNWKLANEVCQYVASRDGFELDPAFDPTSVVVPGRMDTRLLPNGSVLIMDGAHNGQKMSAFVGSFQAKFPDKTAIVLLALKQGKEYKEVLDMLQSIADKLLITTFSTSQDLPAVSQDPDVIEDYATSIGIDATVVSNHADAYRQLVASESEIKIITGSFYLLGQVRSISDST